VPATTVTSGDVPATKFVSPTYSAVTSRSYHPGGVNVLKADGSVEFISSTVNGDIWRALGTPASGEVISSDSY